MRRYRLNISGRHFVVDVDELAANRFTVILDEQPYEVVLEDAEEHARPAVTPMVVVEGFPAHAAAPVPITPATAATPPVPPPRPAPMATSSARLPPATPMVTPGANSQGVLAAPMPGTVLSIEATPGQPVRRGDPLLVLEAMKMQNIIRAPADAVVAEILAQPGQTVGFGQPLVRFAEVAL